MKIRPRYVLLILGITLKIILVLVNPPLRTLVKTNDEYIDPFTSEPVPCIKETWIINTGTINPETGPSQTSYNYLTLTGRLAILALLLPTIIILTPTRKQQN